MEEEEIEVIDLVSDGEGEYFSEPFIDDEVEVKDEDGEDFSDVLVSSECCEPSVARNGVLGVATNNSQKDECETVEIVVEEDCNESDEEEDEFRSRTKLFVQHLPNGFTTQDLSKMFSYFGVILDAKVEVYPKYNAPCGWGYVEFEHPEDATKALQMNGLPSVTKTISVERWVDGIERGSNIIVVGMDVESKMTESDLRQYFIDFGYVIKTNFVQSKKAFFVQFRTRKSADDAILSRDNTVLVDRIIRVSRVLKPADETRLKCALYAKLRDEVENGVDIHSSTLLRRTNRNRHHNGNKKNDIKSRLGPMPGSKSRISKNKSSVKDRLG